MAEVGDSKIASDLLRQINTPIDGLYPEEFVEVSMRGGASLSTIAEQYLGDPLQFYGLARYNEIEEPGKTTAGQVIKVPLTTQAKKFIATPPKNIEEPDSLESDTRRSDVVELEGSVAGDSAILIDEEAGPTLEVVPETVDYSKVELSQGDADSDEMLSNLLADKNYEAVIAEFEELGNKGSLDQATLDGVIDAYHREASQAFRHQDLDRAIELWEKVMVLDPNHAHASNSLIQAQELKQKLQRLE